MLAPGATIGILGGGQLGRMLALAGIPLGLSFRFLDPSPDAPAGEVGELLVGAYDDPELLDRLAEGAAAVTYEFENVPVEAARRAGAIPAAAALEPPLAEHLEWALGAELVDVTGEERIVLTINKEMTDRPIPDIEELLAGEAAPPA